MHDDKSEQLRVENVRLAEKSLRIASIVVPYLGNTPTALLILFFEFIVFVILFLGALDERRERIDNEKGEYSDE